MALIEGLFLWDEYFTINDYVPCQTLIPYSENELIIEQCNVFIIDNGKYLDNLNNMPIDFDIFLGISLHNFLNVRCLSKIIPNNVIFCLFYSWGSNFNIR